MKIGTDGIMLGAWASVEGIRNALDIGTGTGLIALMLAQRAPEAKVHGIDIDEISCEQAAGNAESAPWADRLKIIQAPVQDYALDTGTQYDLVVSNPPFFSGGTFDMEERRMLARHTARLPHGDLLIAVRKLLAPQGHFCVILPYLEGLRFQERAEEYHLFCTRATEVLPMPGRPVKRLLMEFGQTPKACVTDQLIIRKTEAEDSYTEAYKSLTQAFLLNF